MNRRKFLTISTGAVASTVAVAGCLGNSNEPDIPVDIETSNVFDNLATHEEPEVTTTTTDDGDEHVTVKYRVTPTDGECVDVVADITVYDDDNVVLVDGEDRDQFDPGDTYQMDQTITHSADEIHRISIGLSLNTISAKCYM